MITSFVSVAEKSKDWLLRVYFVLRFHTLSDSIIIIPIATTWRFRLNLPKFSLFESWKYGSGGFGDRKDTGRKEENGGSTST
ncbi:hypothetical protein L1987_76588 [Smallanthus sonchifolius]|uniref:Uncharacterized protein n=1 Tax=Smallanthus sonchifolius TaxID=185202 RepID=A0ACB8ZC08_9ASTR|nr:hypothetical protein L1987_76588 [Smallanthus sonchifolius]